MDELEDKTTGKLFESLTPDQKNELMLADDGSRDEKNWLSDEEVRKKHQKWLKE